MTFFLRGALALTMTASLSGWCSAQQAQDGLVSQLGQVTGSPGEVELVSCNSCDSYSCNSCDSGSCGGGGGLDLGLSGLGSQQGQFFVGAEYLSVRANFSEATAYIDTDLAANTYTLQQFEFDYTESYRFYGGYRLCNCGGEIRFTYSNLSSDGSFDSGLLNTAGATRSFTSPFEVVTAGDGDRLTGRASVDINNYDVGFSKTIPLGSPLGCCDTGCGDTCCGDSCGDCCDPCGGSCPAWDITWTGAIRVANVDSRLGYASIIDPVNTAAPSRTAESVVSFDGVGLRTGLLGRRYLGKSGMASVFIKGDISLLLGEVDHYSVGTATARTQISTTEVIPVTEMEAGATVYLMPNVSVTGGYMLSAWHDLGHRSQYDFSATGIQVIGMDDANMMMFDGIFLRAEAAF